MWPDATPASTARSRVAAAASTCPVANWAVPRVVSRALCQYPLPLTVSLPLSAAAAVRRIPPASPWKY